MSEICLHRDVVEKVNTSGREPTPGYFRKSINGQMMIVEDEINLSPFNVAFLIFCNRARDELKALYWDEAAKANGLSPFNYLMYLLEELPKQPEDLVYPMPWNVSLETVI